MQVFDFQEIEAGEGIGFEGAYPVQALLVLGVTDATGFGTWACLFEIGFAF
jgi:hypothetical protein